MTRQSVKTTKKRQKMAECLSLWRSYIKEEGEKSIIIPL